MRLALAGLVLVASACTDLGPRRFEGSVKLGGVDIDAVTLNRGRDSYNLYCHSCHGYAGDGQGPLGVHQEPRARDLRLGIIKLASVAAGELPTDADLARVLRRGVPGTAMLPWKVPKEEVLPVVHYIKVFSERWRSEAAGEPVAITADPWNDNAQAVARGGQLYHGVARCSACHPGYISREEVDRIAGEVGLDPADLWRDDFTAALTKDSAYGPLAASVFGEGPLRGGDSPEDLFRVIAAGIGGTAMPTWKGALPDEDLWALAHYVESLARR